MEFRRTGTIAVMLYGDLARPDVSKFDFFLGLCYSMSATGAGLRLTGCIHFLYKSKGKGD